MAGGTEVLRIRSKLRQRERKCTKQGEKVREREKGRGTEQFVNRGVKSGCQHAFLSLIIRRFHSRNRRKQSRVLSQRPRQAICVTTKRRMQSQIT